MEPLSGTLVFISKIAEGEWCATSNPGTSRTKTRETVSIRLFMRPPKVPPVYYRESSPPKLGGEPSEARRGGSRKEPPDIALLVYGCALSRLRFASRNVCPPNLGGQTLCHDHGWWPGRHDQAVPPIRRQQDSSAVLADRGTQHIPATRY